MGDRLPRWAQQLKDRHPDGEMPTRERPIPDWLELELKRRPLWYVIREAPSARSAHPYMVYEEIQREPGQWTDIAANAWPDVEAVADTIVARGIERLIFTGCGSAFFTAIHDAYLFPRITGLAAAAIESFELAHYFPPVAPEQTLVVGHSGTGGSIETIEAMAAARDRGCLTLAVTNTEDTGVERASELHLTYLTHQACGPCISVVSTRIMLTTMLALALAKRRGDPHGSAANLLRELPRIGEVGAGFLAAEDRHVHELARTLSSAQSVFVVGSGPNYFSAREGTLKIEEQAIVVGKAYRTGDFHHDALSLLSPERAVIAIEAEGPANARVVDVVRAARETGSPTVAVTWSGDAGGDDLADVADHRLGLDGALPELIVPIAMTLVFQLLGYYLGVERGYNPDTLRTDHLPNARAWVTAFPLGTH